MAYLKLLSTNHRVNETVSIIRDRNYIPRDRLGGPLNKVVLLNGVYDLETRALSQFDPELYAITQLQLTLNPEAKCPAIMKFLGEVLNEIDIPKVEELIGYTLYRKYPIARIFVLTGEGQNGKSTLLRLIGTFLGKENISSLTLQEISEDRFAKASLFGKLANICADIPATPIKYTGIIKILTGEDETTAQFKFKDLFGFFNFAKLIFSANEVPQTYDNTVAFFRRMILISFPNQFPADDPQTDPNILDKITTPEELSGLFNLAINGLRRLLEQGHFTNEESVESRSKSYVLASNPAQFFINSFVEMSDNTLNYIAKDELYKRYAKATQKLGRRPLASNKFSMEITRYLPYVDEGMKELLRSEKQGAKPKDKAENIRVWYGIRLRASELADFMREDEAQRTADKQVGADQTSLGVNEPQTSLAPYDQYDGAIDSTPKRTAENNIVLGYEVSLDRIDRVASGETPKKDEQQSGVLSEKLKQILDVVRRSVDPISEDEISRATGLAGEEVLRLCKALERDKLAYTPIPGKWRASL